MMKNTLTTKLLPVALALLASAPPAAFSASPDAEIEALRAELAALRVRVERLEKDVDEGVAINPARKVQPQPGGADNPKNWKLLAKGMEADRVVEILGTPGKTKSVKKHEIWYYPNGKTTFYLRRLKSFTHN
jgi:hypothetical protein